MSQVFCKSYLPYKSIKMKVNVFNLILFDESGSMESIRKPAIESLNETLQSIQRAQSVHQEYQKHFVTLVCFNAKVSKRFMMLFLSRKSE